MNEIKIKTITLQQQQINTQPQQQQHYQVIKQINHIQP